MSCCHHYFAATEGGDTAFTIDIPPFTFGRGCLAEAGDRARDLGMKRVALFTDKALAGLPHVAAVKKSLTDAGCDVAVYDEVKVEPTDVSFKKAARFATEGKFDGFVSVGGGSVMDTCKAANLYSSHPADFLAYVNAPIGGAQVPKGPLKPHVACPTTSGTGSECTGIAIFDLTSMKAKTGIMLKCIRPTFALIDPAVTETLPANVVAASGFDLMSHALESYTARPYARRARPERAGLRPVSQGANPLSDTVDREALGAVGKFLVRGVRDAGDVEARTELMYAATLAGIGFGNAGCHLPHGMSYAVSGMVREFRCHGYPQDEPMVPHGMSVVLNAPSVFRFTAQACPDRHLEAAQHLGADARGAVPADAGEVIARRLIELMRATELPNGLSGVGYSAEDAGALADGAFPQKRVIANSPREVSRDELKQLFVDAIRYW
ncbi:MAG TPA: hydroxyacid-oxoacid transhydrogenase [Burkholderiales bacterium]|nr:hydroxyacid-oxoacid transhydrogenase [Burkholderiales bacterium]